LTGTQQIHDKTVGVNPRPFRRPLRRSSCRRGRRDRRAVENGPLGSSSEIARRSPPAGVTGSSNVRYPGPGHPRSLRPTLCGFTSLNSRSTYPFGLAASVRSPLCRIRAAAHVSLRPCCREQSRLRPMLHQPATLESTVWPIRESLSRMGVGTYRNGSSFCIKVQASSNRRRATATTAVRAPAFRSTRSNRAM
jgi:hypothetical protein